MIDISPKALRFARLAAERQTAFASDPQIALIKRKEDSFRQKDSRNRVERYVKISETTAVFCIRAMSALLETPEQFESSEWDGNDFVFLQAASKSLHQQLLQSNARSP